MDGNSSEAAELFWHRALEGRRKASQPEIVSFNKTGNRIPLYLFPSVALGPTEFLQLGKSFDPEQPWHILIPPLRRYKAGANGLIKEIAIRFAKRLDEIQPKGQKMVIGGWSAGVTLALELARQLRERGRDVPLLIAIDFAPENTGITEGPETIGYKFRRAIHESRQQDKSWPATATALARTLATHAADVVLRRKLDDIDKLQRGNPNIFPEQMVQIRRFYAASFACPPPAPYDGKVLLIEASHEHHRHVRAKWESFASDVETVAIDGTHRSIIYWKAAAQLGELLNRRLCALSSP